MNGQGTQLVLPDGMTVEVTKAGYNCPAMPALGKVLDYLYPVDQNPATNARRIGNNYGWRLHEAEKAILARNNHSAGVGL